MKTKRFELLPLVWEEDKNGNFSASTVFGSIQVEKRIEWRTEPETFLGWQWRYCFDEYYDEGSTECESVEQGKELAEAFYVSRIMPALKPVTRKTKDR